MMCIRAKMPIVASDCARRENVSRYIPFYMNVYIKIRLRAL